MSRRKSKAPASPLLTRKDLLATIFHELRTRISSINGYALLVLSGELGKMEQGQRETLDRIQELCQQMTALTNNLLTALRTDGHSRALMREFVDVGLTAREVIRSLQGVVRRKKLKMVVGLPEKEIRYWVDPSEMNQLILNLLSNAVKFTPEEGQVALKLSRSDSKILLQVSDTGVGIPKRDLPRIFRSFYHVDHPEVGASEGIGLGLSIVRRIVQTYGGQIQVSSKLGKGTKFKVSLPVRHEQEILVDFLREVSVQSKQSFRSAAVLMFELRRFKAKPLTSAEMQDDERIFRLLERVLRAALRPEDRIFRYARGSLLAVLLMLDEKDFNAVARRLQGVIAQALGGEEQTHRYHWRMATFVTTRGKLATPKELLAGAKKQLQDAWKRPFQQEFDS